MCKASFVGGILVIYLGLFLKILKVSTLMSLIITLTNVIQTKAEKRKQVIIEKSNTNIKYIRMQHTTL